MEADGSAGVQLIRQGFERGGTILRYFSPLLFGQPNLQIQILPLNYTRQSSYTYVCTRKPLFIYNNVYYICV
jgi:hypothetical protein